MSEIFLRNKLQPLQQHFLWFQQDGAAAHTAKISKQVVRALLPGRLISRLGNITWPAHSPDSAVQGYFLSGYVRSKVNVTRSANIDDLKRNFGLRSRDL
jgi:hypothetical protein